MITAYFLQNDPALIERRIRPTETRPVQIVGQSMAAILFFGGIIILPSLDYRFEWSFVPPWVSVLSAVVMLTVLFFARFECPVILAAHMLGLSL